MEFKEGCVTIRFDPSKGKQCVTYIIDFGETDINPSEAATITKKIVTILRKELGLSLSSFQ